METETKKPEVITDKLIKELPANPAITIAFDLKANRVIMTCSRSANGLEANEARKLAMALRQAANQLERLRGK